MIDNLHNLMMGKRKATATKRTVSKENDKKLEFVDEKLEVAQENGPKNDQEHDNEHGHEDKEDTIDEFSVEVLSPTKLSSLNQRNMSR
jgi:hypothetical protein